MTDPSDQPSTNEAARPVYHVDEILDALRSKHRRYLLYYLQDEEHATLEELATQLATWEPAQSSGTSHQEHQEQLERSLYHRDLPEFAESNLIEYDQRSKHIRYREPPTVQEKFLMFTATIEKPNHSD